jgi:hypothetical protein
MLYRILIAWLYALSLCAALFLLIHIGFGVQYWDDPIFRRYAVGMVALLSIAATTPIYGLVWR